MNHQMAAEFYISEATIMIKIRITLLVNCTRGTPPKDTSIYRFWSGVGGCHTRQHFEQHFSDHVCVFV